MHWFPIILGTWNETLRVCAPTVIDQVLGRVKKDVCDQRLDEWAATACRLADVRISVEGDENLEDLRNGESFVVISNHQSSYDIFVLMHTYPSSLRMVAKKQIFQVPVMGGAMKASGFVSVDRSNSEGARQSLENAKAAFEAGTSIWIAPEGTRSPDGRLLPFKKGGFMLALSAQRRILPVTLIDTNTILPSKDHKVRSGKHVRVRFHPPVDPADFGVERRDELVEHVRNVIISGQPEELRQ